MSAKSDSHQTSPSDLSTQREESGEKRPKKRRPHSHTYPERKKQREAVRKGTSAMGLKERKTVQKKLVEGGVRKESLPAIFRDKELKRSRKGPAGQIIVKSLSGVQQNAAAKLARRFEQELTDGKEDIAEKLESLPPERQSKIVQRLITTLRSNPRWSFARCVAESKANLATTMNAYAEGLLAQKKLESLMEMYRQMPHLVRDIMHHAIDKEVACGVCFGEGKVTSRAGGTTLNRNCPRCGGTGTTRESSPHKAMAVKEAVEISKLKPEKGPLVAVQNNQVVNAAGSADGNLLERMAKATDDVLYGDRDREEPIDAEIVLPDDLPVED